MLSDAWSISDYRSRSSQPWTDILEKKIHKTQQNNILFSTIEFISHYPLEQSKITWDMIVQFWDLLSIIHDQCSWLSTQSIIISHSGSQDRADSGRIFPVSSIGTFPFIFQVGNPAT